MATLVRIDAVPEELQDDEIVDRYRILCVSDEERKIEAFLYSNDDEISDDEIREKFDDIYAEDDAQLTHIGEIEVEEDDNEGNIWLKQVEVDVDYRQNGIASKLVVLAVEHLGLACIACVQEHSSYVYDLTQAGERLIASCLRNNLIQPNMCFFSGDVPLDGDDSDDEADGDPGYDSLLVRQALPHQPLQHGAYAHPDSDDDSYGAEPPNTDDDASEYDEATASPRDEVQRVAGRQNLFRREDAVAAGSSSDDESEDDTQIQARQRSPSPSRQ